MRRSTASCATQNSITRLEPAVKRARQAGEIVRVLVLSTRSPGLGRRASLTDGGAPLRAAFGLPPIAGFVARLAVVAASI